MTCQCRPACKWPSGGSAPGSIYHHSPGRGVGGVCPTLKQRKGPDTALSISLLGTEPPDVRAERPQAKEAAAVCLANSLRVIRRLLSWREVVGQQAERAPGEPALMRLLLGPHHGFLETGLQGPPRPSVPLPQARGGGGHTDAGKAMYRPSVVSVGLRSLTFTCVPSRHCKRLPSPAPMPAAAF